MTEKTAAVVAAVMFAVGGATGIGWRSWLQRRRTGSTGFRGISGRPGSPEWSCGVGLVIGVALTLAAPVLQLVGVVSPLPVLDVLWIQAAGIVLAVAGIGATVYAQIDMGDSWRIGVDATETTTLVRTGVFGVVRNPIFTAMFVFWLGTTLITPNVVAVVGYLVVVLSIEAQVRLVEEPYLMRVHGDDYREYTSSVGRFIPNFGRMR